jgi:hypothetical protein
MSAFAELMLNVLLKVLDPLKTLFAARVGIALAAAPPRLEALI